ncbi:MAG: tRNA pseudouridine(55) synthase TruB [Thermoleophilia bacterium]|nr:tRNA pseudouridine(55) synthase TruB [Thermoleophilia bacterium]
MAPSTPSLSRVLLVDKPVGPTSFDVVRTVRRGLGGSRRSTGTRVGHAGTLDPFASGLLLVMVGQATRISNLLMGLPKEYEVTVQFGAVSTTADPTGEITPTGRRTQADQVLAALDGFRGTIRQRVPLTSAVKVDGEALYKKAHRGETAETPEREVTIYDLTMLQFDDEAQTARLLALTGSGTYVRTLAEQIGSALGVGAFAAALRRTRIGGFSVDDALQMSDLTPETYAVGGRGVRSLDEALAFLPSHLLDAAQARLAANGNPLPAAPYGRFRVHGPEGLIGVYEAKDDMARPMVVFARPA